MTTKQLWTVYTVQEHPGGGWAIVASRWEETGPVSAKFVARLTDMTLAEAQGHADHMQRQYDETRRAIA